MSIICYRMPGHPRQRARRFLVMPLVPQSSRCPAALAEFPPRPTLVHPFPAQSIGAVPPSARVEPLQVAPLLTVNSTKFKLAITKSYFFLRLPVLHHAENSPTLPF